MQECRRICARTYWWERYVPIIPTIAEYFHKHLVYLAVIKLLDQVKFLKWLPDFRHVLLLNDQTNSGLKDDPECDCFSFIYFEFAVRVNALYCLFWQWTLSSHTTLLRQDIDNENWNDPMKLWLSGGDIINGKMTSITRIGNWRRDPLLQRIKESCY